MRWTPRRKAELLRALDGAESLEAFCARNGADPVELADLSDQEIASWRKLFVAHGWPGLRTTRLQTYRPTPPRRTK